MAELVKQSDDGLEINNSELLTLANILAPDIPTEVRENLNDPNIRADVIQTLVDVVDQRELNYGPNEELGEWVGGKLTKGEGFDEAGQKLLNFPNIQPDTPLHDKWFKPKDVVTGAPEIQPPLSPQGEKYLESLVGGGEALEIPEDMGHKIHEQPSSTRSRVDALADWTRRGEEAAQRGEKFTEPRPEGVIPEILQNLQQIFERDSEEEEVDRVDREFFMPLVQNPQRLLLMSDENVRRAMTIAENLSLYNLGPLELPDEISPMDTSEADSVLAQVDPERQADLINAVMAEEMNKNDDVRTEGRINLEEVSPGAYISYMRALKGGSGSPEEFREILGNKDFGTKNYRSPDQIMQGILEQAEQLRDFDPDAWKKGSKYTTEFFSNRTTEGYVNEEARQTLMALADKLYEIPGITGVSLTGAMARAILGAEFFDTDQTQPRYEGVPLFDSESPIELNIAHRNNADLVTAQEIIDEATQNLTGSLVNREIVVKSHETKAGTHSYGLPLQQREPRGTRQYEGADPSKLHVLITGDRFYGRAVHDVGQRRGISSPTLNNVVSDRTSKFPSSRHPGFGLASYPHDTQPGKVQYTIPTEEHINKLSITGPGSVKNKQEIAFYNDFKERWVNLRQTQGATPDAIELAWLEMAGNTVDVDGHIHVPKSVGEKPIFITDDIVEALSQSLQSIGRTDTEGNPIYHEQEYAEGWKRYPITQVNGEMSENEWIDKMRDFLMTLPEDAVIIQGGAPGADMLAAHLARELNAKKLKNFSFENTNFPANWSAGRQGGQARNQDMFDKSLPHIVAYFHNDIANSSGTQGMLEYVKGKGIPIVNGLDPDYPSLETMQQLVNRELEEQEQIKIPDATVVRVPLQDVKNTEGVNTLRRFDVGDAHFGNPFTFQAASSNAQQGARYILPTRDEAIKAYELWLTGKDEELRSLGGPTNEWTAWEQQIAEARANQDGVAFSQLANNSPTGGQWNIKPQDIEGQRQWILQQLPSLKGKQLIYFNEAEEGSHAEVLAGLANAAPLTEEQEQEVAQKQRAINITNQIRETLNSNYGFGILADQEDVPVSDQHQVIFKDKNLVDKLPSIGGRNAASLLRSQDLDNPRPLITLGNPNWEELRANGQKITPEMLADPEANNLSKAIVFTPDQLGKLDPETALKVALSHGMPSINGADKHSNPLYAMNNLGHDFFNSGGIAKDDEGNPRGTIPNKTFHEADHPASIFQHFTSNQWVDYKAEDSTAKAPQGGWGPGPQEGQRQVQLNQDDLDIALKQLVEFSTHATLKELLQSVEITPDKVNRDAFGNVRGGFEHRSTIVVPLPDEYNIERNRDKLSPGLRNLRVIESNIKWPSGRRRYSLVVPLHIPTKEEIQSHLDVQQKSLADDLMTKEFGPNTRHAVHLIDDNGQVVPLGSMVPRWKDLLKANVGDVEDIRYQWIPYDHATKKLDLTKPSLENKTYIFKDGEFNLSAAQFAQLSGAGKILKDSIYSPHHDEILKALGPTGDSPYATERLVSLIEHLATQYPNASDDELAGHIDSGLRDIHRTVGGFSEKFINPIERREGGGILKRRSGLDSRRQAPNPRLESNMYSHEKREYSDDDKKSIFTWIQDLLLNKERSLLGDDWESYAYNVGYPVHAYGEDENIEVLPLLSPSQASSLLIEVAKFINKQGNLNNIHNPQTGNSLTREEVLKIWKENPDHLPRLFTQTLESHLFSGGDFEDVLTRTELQRQRDLQDLITPLSEAEAKNWERAGIFNVPPDFLLPFTDEGLIDVAYQGGLGNTTANFINKFYSKLPALQEIAETLGYPDARTMLEDQTVLLRHPKSKVVNDRGQWVNPTNPSVGYHHIRPEDLARFEQKIMHWSQISPERLFRLSLTNLNRADYHYLSDEVQKAPERIKKNVAAKTYEDIRLYNTLIDNLMQFQEEGGGVKFDKIYENEEALNQTFPNYSSEQIASIKKLLDIVASSSDLEREDEIPSFSTQMNNPVIAKILDPLFGTPVTPEEGVQRGGFADKLSKEISSLSNTATIEASLYDDPLGGVGNRISGDVYYPYAHVLHQTADGRVVIAPFVVSPVQQADGSYELSPEYTTRTGTRGRLSRSHIKIQDALEQIYNDYVTEMTDGAGYVPIDLTPPADLNFTNKESVQNWVTHLITQLRDFRSTYGIHKTGELKKSFPHESEGQAFYARIDSILNYLGRLSYPSEDPSHPLIPHVNMKTGLMPHAIRLPWSAEPTDQMDKPIKSYHAVRLDPRAATPATVDEYVNHAFVYLSEMLNETGLLEGGMLQTDDNGDPSWVTKPEFINSTADRQLQNGRTLNEMHSYITRHLKDVARQQFEGNPDDARHAWETQAMILVNRLAEVFASNTPPGSLREFLTNEEVGRGADRRALAEERRVRPQVLFENGELNPDALIHNDGLFPMPATLVKPGGVNHARTIIDPSDNSNGTIYREGTTDILSLGDPDPILQVPLHTGDQLQTDVVPRIQPTGPREAIVYDPNTGKFTVSYNNGSIYNRNGELIIKGLPMHTFMEMIDGKPLSLREDPTGISVEPLVDTGTIRMQARHFLGDAEADKHLGIRVQDEDTTPDDGSAIFRLDSVGGELVWRLYNHILDMKPKQRDETHRQIQWEMQQRPQLPTGAQGALMGYSTKTIDTHGRKALHPRLPYMYQIGNQTYIRGDASDFFEEYFGKWVEGALKATKIEPILPAGDRQARMTHQIQMQRVNRNTLPATEIVEQQLKIMPPPYNTLDLVRSLLASPEDAIWNIPKPPQETALQTIPKDASTLASTLAGREVIPPVKALQTIQGKPSGLGPEWVQYSIAKGLLSRITDYSDDSAEGTLRLMLSQGDYISPVTGESMLSPSLLQKAIDGNWDKKIVESLYNLWKGQGLEDGLEDQHPNFTKLTFPQGPKTWMRQPNLSITQAIRLYEKGKIPNEINHTSVPEIERIDGAIPLTLHKILDKVIGTPESKKQNTDQNFKAMQEALVDGKLPGREDLNDELANIAYLGKHLFEINGLPNHTNIDDLNNLITGEGGSSLFNKDQTVIWEPEGPEENEDGTYKGGLTWFLNLINLAQGRLADPNMPFSRESRQTEAFENYVRGQDLYSEYEAAVQNDVTRENTGNNVETVEDIWETYNNNANIGGPSVQSYEEVWNEPITNGKLSNLKALPSDDLLPWKLGNKAIKTLQMVGLLTDYPNELLDKHGNEKGGWHIQRFVMVPGGIDPSSIVNENNEPTPVTDWKMMPYPQLGYNPDLGGINAFTHPMKWGILVSLFPQINGIDGEFDYETLEVGLTKRDIQNTPTDYSSWEMGEVSKPTHHLYPENGQKRFVRAVSGETLQNALRTFLLSDQRIVSNGHREFWAGKYNELGNFTDRMYREQGEIVEGVSPDWPDIEEPDNRLSEFQVIDQHNYIPRWYTKNRSGAKAGPQQPVELNEELQDADQTDLDTEEGVGPIESTRQRIQRSGEGGGGSTTRSIGGTDMPEHTLRVSRQRPSEEDDEIVMLIPDQHDMPWIGVSVTPPRLTATGHPPYTWWNLKFDLSDDGYNIPGQYAGEKRIDKLPPNIKQYYEDITRAMKDGGDPSASISHTVRQMAHNEDSEIRNQIPMTKFNSLATEKDKNVWRVIAHEYGKGDGDIAAAMDEVGLNPDGDAHRRFNQLRDTPDAEVQHILERRVPPTAPEQGHMEDLKSKINQLNRKITSRGKQEGFDLPSEALDGLTSTELEALYSAKQKEQATKVSQRQSNEMVRAANNLDHIQPLSPGAGPEAVQQQGRQLLLHSEQYDDINPITNAELLTKETKARMSEMFNELKAAGLDTAGLISEWKSVVDGDTEGDAWKSYVNMKEADIARTQQDEQEIIDHFTNTGQDYINNRHNRADSYRVDGRLIGSLADPGVDDTEASMIAGISPQVHQWWQMYHERKLLLRGTSEEQRPDLAASIAQLEGLLLRSGIQPEWLEDAGKTQDERSGLAYGPNGLPLDAEGIEEQPPMIYNPNTGELEAARMYHEGTQAWINPWIIQRNLEGLDDHMYVGHHGVVNQHPDDVNPELGLEAGDPALQAFIPSSQSTLNEEGTLVMGPTGIHRVYRNDVPTKDMGPMNANKTAGYAFGTIVENEIQNDPTNYESGIVPMSFPVGAVPTSQSVDTLENTGIAQNIIRPPSQQQVQPQEATGGSKAAQFLAQIRQRDFTGSKGYITGRETFGDQLYAGIREFADNMGGLWHTGLGALFPATEGYRMRRAAESQRVENANKRQIFMDYAETRGIEVTPGIQERMEQEYPMDPAVGEEAPPPAPTVRPPARTGDILRPPTGPEVPTERTSSQSPALDAFVASQPTPPPVDPNQALIDQQKKVVRPNENQPSS